MFSCCYTDASFFVFFSLLEHFCQHDLERITSSHKIPLSSLLLAGIFPSLALCDALRTESVYVWWSNSLKITLKALLWHLNSVRELWLTPYCSFRQDTSHLTVLDLIYISVAKIGWERGGVGDKKKTSGIRTGLRSSLNEGYAHSCFILLCAMHWSNKNMLQR